MLYDTHHISYQKTQKDAKMAAEEKQQINDVLETLVSVTEKSGKLRKDLKQDIHESVSKLRKLFSHL